MDDHRPYTVVVTGSRRWDDAPTIGLILADRQSRHGALRIVEGGARGADQWAKQWAQWAQRLGYPVQHEQYPADWDNDGKAAGPIRNRNMLDLENPDEVLAFPRGESRGTRDCIHKAHDRGIPVTVTEWDEVEEAPSL